MEKKYTPAAVLLITYSLFIICATTSCASNKRGCPSNGANVGAERVLGGEKGLKKSKFKIKGMS